MFCDREGCFAELELATALHATQAQKELAARRSGWRTFPTTVRGVEIRHLCRWCVGDQKKADTAARRNTPTAPPQPTLFDEE